LTRIGIIPNTEIACVADCGISESVQHLFLGCMLSNSVWQFVWKWIGIDFVASNNISHHFVHFSCLVGMPRSTFIFFKVIWLASVWVIWKEQNYRVFKNTAYEPWTLIEKVKLNSFLWLKSKHESFVYSFHDWWKHTLLCMGVHL
jgi:hypothetical protein